MFLLAALQLSAPLSRAADIYSTGSGNWGAASTWGGGAVPGPADAAMVYNGKTVTLNSAEPAVTQMQILGAGVLDVASGGALAPGWVGIGTQAGAATLNVAGGQLAATGSVVVGYNAGSTATVNLSAGTLSSTLATPVTNGGIVLGPVAAGAATTTVTQTGGVLATNSAIELGGEGAATSTGATYAVSGGTVHWGTTFKVFAGNTVEIDGTGATLAYSGAANTTSDVFELGGTLNVHLDADGVSAIDCGTSQIGLGTASVLDIDGSAFTGTATTQIPLILCGKLSAASGFGPAFGSVRFTGFKPGYRPVVVYNADSVVLAVIRLSTARKPLLGAIRWDAWEGTGAVYDSAQAALGPEEWHYRLPFFGAATASDSVTIDGSSQAVMDQEITAAVHGGLSYWAFDMYDRDDAMCIPLNAYLDSAKRSQIDFCMVTQAGFWNQPDYISYLVSLLGEPGYQTVLDGRPLVYIIGLSPGLISSYDMTTKIAQFRATVQAAGQPNPYIVVMDFDPASAASYSAAVGADAISSYAFISATFGTTFQGLASRIPYTWNAARATGQQVVPILTTGFDNRPLTDDPPSWYAGIATSVFGPPTPPQLGAEVSSAIDWMALNEESSEAGVAIAYAWNEFAEGGWLCPTLSEGTARLDAIAAALNGYDQDACGFETPALPVHGYQYGATGSPWTFSASGAGIAANGSAFTQYNPAAPEGVQVAFLQETGSMSQTLAAFVPGTSYTVTFSAAERAINATAQTWDFRVGTETVASFAPGHAATGYAAYSATFVASAPSQTLQFVGTNLNGGDNTVFLDDVRVAPTAYNGNPSPYATSSAWPATDADIGAVGFPGAFSALGINFPNGTFSETGSGAGILGTADGFHFAYQTLGSAFTLTARIASVPTSNANAQAGVMLRQSTAANAPYVLCGLTGGGKAQFQSRAVAGGGSTVALTNGVSAPYWVRLVLAGTTATGYISPDGARWTQIGTAPFGPATHVLAGFAASGDDNTQVGTAGFSNPSATSP